ncbi:hypothetical protein ADN00_09285 [Ornatilinea apprima]|uniref:Methyltransferase type 11 domain-containing protein n=1 Tax=Ornatilinea apprima TaxID=1134406 RepID=A0A0P6XPX2_9CHLR|nr:class I SAM-dependent methyltransferase [Ornatilinea apprima]KPL77312.1 hypothetical protein ADN00_09285 [Ornatilinea apprima]
MKFGIVRKTIHHVVQKNMGEMRRGKYQSVLQELQAGATVVDIGVWCKMPEPNVNENWLEKQAPGSGKLIAVGLDSMQAFQKKYPEVICVQANGMALPFKDGAVDIAISNAVLEHVPMEGHKDFVFEITRIVKRVAIFAVPDRAFPVEVHSRIPFLHWLPNWREVFRLVGEKNWASKEYLATIFTIRSLKNLIYSVRPKKTWQIKRQKFFGWPVSLIAAFSPQKQSE